MTPPKRRPRSLIGSLERFFEANPDEELEVGDVAVKYDMPIKSVYSRLGEAMREGTTLEFVRIVRRKK